MANSSISVGGGVGPPLYTHTPANMHALNGWTFDVGNITGNAAPSAATIYLQKMAVPQTITITNVVVDVEVAGTSYTNSQLGVYSSAGALLGATAVLASGGTNTFGTLGTATVALSAAATVTGGPTVFVWLALHMGTNSATAAQFAVHASGVTAAANRGINVNLAAASMRHAVQTGHATSDLATIGTLTPASNATGSSNIFWMGTS